MTSLYNHKRSDIDPESTGPMSGADLKESYVGFTDGPIRPLEYLRSDIGSTVRFQGWCADAQYPSAKNSCRWTEKALEIGDAAGLSVEGAVPGAFGMITTVGIIPNRGIE